MVAISPPAIDIIHPAVLLLLFYRPLKRDIVEPSYFERLRTRIDWVGNALWILGFVPFMMG